MCLQIHTFLDISWRKCSIKMIIWRYDMAEIMVRVPDAFFFFFSLTHRNIFQLVLQLAVAMWPSSGQCVQAEVEYAPSTLLRRHPVLLQLSLLLFFFDCQADAEDAGKGIQMSAEIHHRGSWFLQDVGAEPPHWPKSDMVMSVK